MVLLKNCRVIDSASHFDGRQDILVGDGIPIDASNWIACPGLTDLHVHFRQPGFEHKETISTGFKAAVAGGVTNVVVMPNTNPPLDSPERVKEQTEIARQLGYVNLMVAAAATVGMKGQVPTDIAALKNAGAVAITDDGMPVMDDAVMAEVFRQCAQNDVVFMQHAEDWRLSHKAAMNQGVISKKIGIVGQDPDAEGVMVERDIQLAEKYGARYHVLHISTKRALKAVRDAKNRGLPVSCEVTPHHLVLTDAACEGQDPNKKMNPPLRNEADRLALIEALADGTIDAVASDHAPHSAEEKGCGFLHAPFGVVGLETAFAVLLRFVHDKTISLSRAVELMTTGPANVLRRPELGALENPAQSLCLFDPNFEWTVQTANLHGRSQNSAFLGMQLKGKVIATFSNGQLQFHEPGVYRV